MSHVLDRWGRPQVRAAAGILGVLFLLFLLIVAPTAAQEDPHHPPAEKGADDHGAEHEGGGGGGEHHMSLLMAWKAFLIQLIGFGMLLGLFGWLAWPALAATLAKRGGDIADTYRRLDEAKSETDKLLKEFETRISLLPDEERSRIHNAKAEGARLRDEMIREAETQAARIVDKARREIEIMRDVAVIEVRQAALAQALQSAEERLRKEVDVKTHHQLVNAFILDVERARDLLHKGGPA